MQILTIIPVWKAVSLGCFYNFCYFDRFANFDSFGIFYSFWQFLAMFRSFDYGTMLTFYFFLLVFLNFPLFGYRAKKTFLKFWILTGGFSVLADVFFRRKAESNVVFRFQIVSAVLALESMTNAETQILVDVIIVNCEQ